MNFKLYLVFFALTNLSAFAQKPSITNDMYGNWDQLREIKPNIFTVVSNDGKYLAYRVGSRDRGDSLIFQGIHSNYRFSVLARSRNEYFDPQISFDEYNELAYFKKQSDTLCILDLKSSVLQKIPNIRSFSLLGNKKNSYLVLFYQGSSGFLSIKNVRTGANNKYYGVSDYILSPNGSSLVLQKSKEAYFLDLIKGVCKRLPGKGAFFAFDKTGRKLVYLSEKDNLKEIVCFQTVLGKIDVLIDTRNLKLGEFVLANDMEFRFTPNSKKLFFQVSRRIENVFEETENPNITIWNYKDREIEQHTKKFNYLAVLDLITGKIIRLQDDSIDLNYDFDQHNKYVLAHRKIGNQYEYYWNGEQFSIYLISLETGGRDTIKTFPPNCKTFPLYKMSPLENYIVWMDPNDKFYYCYSIGKRQTIQLSNGMKTSFLNTEEDVPDRQTAFGIAGWLPGEKRLLVYDQYDIWSVDPKGEHPMISLTKDFGRQNRVIVRFVEGGGIYDSVISDHALLTGFGSNTKKNGYWKFSQVGSLKDNSLGDYVYYKNSSSNAFGNSISHVVPQRVNSMEHVVMRMDAGNSPNLFLTKDFIHYEKLTFVGPEKKVNWLTTQLVTWKNSHDQLVEGILYKPADFNPDKKYPVILNYYEKRSDELNWFKTPALSYGDLDIPWYVSNGYIVFVPDIHYKTADNANRIVDCVLSGINELKRNDWFDYQNIGLSGHSFGGYETNVLLTKSNIFKAAQQSAGPFNLISSFSELMGTLPRQYLVEISQSNLGSPPWSSPSTYIINSPIFEVDKISCPVLIMHNKGDTQVQFSQSQELFLSLRRLGKPSWLLSYQNEHHGLTDEENRMDFTTRQQQFFGHYLKGEPMPNWMKGPTTE